MARRLRFQPGSIVVFDRAYVDYAWFEQLTQQGVLSRAQVTMPVTAVEQRPLPQKGPIRRDEIIQLGSHWYRQTRRCAVWKWKFPAGNTLVAIDQSFRFSPTTVAWLYHQRWQVEIFFRTLKQNLRVKKLVGTSSNALKIQIWTALIAVLLLKYLQWRACFAGRFPTWSLYCVNNCLCIGRCGGG
ncbi:MAG: transposase [Terriglobia bacterium]